MTFDNKDRVIGTRIMLLVATVLFITYLVLAYAAKKISFPLLGMDDGAWTTILCALYLIIIIYPSFAKYQYFFFSDNGEKLIFRYFFAGLIGGKKKAIEINKQDFYGYEYTTECLGIRKYLTLYQKIKSNVAKYPPIPISAVSKKNREEMIEKLDKYNQIPSPLLGFKESDRRDDRKIR